MFEPSAHDETCGIMLEEYTNELIETYYQTPILIFGDFNAIIGHSNNIDSLIIDASTKATERYKTK